MWSRVRFENGDQVMVSMASDEVKLFKMKWGGMIPGETLATLDALALVENWDLFAGHDPLSRSTEILDRVTAMVVIWESAAEVEAAFRPKDPRSPPPILKRR